MRVLPTFDHEKVFWEKGLNILGIDEAGRGAFAGPLSVAGVVFDPKFTKKLLTLGINDSKLLSAKKRESLYHEIKNLAIFSHVEIVSLETINEIGIGRATFLGMQNVYRKAEKTIRNIHCLVDAFTIPDVTNQNAIVHGDRISISIAGASILAKVERDLLMEKLAMEFNGYGWEQNKGYGTLSHRLALKELGSTVQHRTQFISNHI